MSHTTDSFFGSAFRAFLNTFARVIGVLLALIAIVFMISLFSSDSAATIEPTTRAKVLPGPNNDRKALESNTPLILEIQINGVIGTPLLNGESIENILLDSREGRFKEGRVKALLLNINSPGGTVVDADRIYHLIKQYKAAYSVPVYAYVDGLCASGGYYIAAAADSIYASDVSLVGSVGVIIPTFFNYTGLLEKVGVKADTLFSGKGKDKMNPFRPWTKEDPESLQYITSYYYQSFVELVTKDRPGLSKEALINDYGAQVFPASDAQEKGYIDVAHATRSIALTALAEKAGLVAGTFQVITLEERNWLKQLFAGEQALFSGKVTHHVKLGPIDDDLMNKPLYLYIAQ